MNSYGDSNPVRARAQVPGLSGDPGPDGDDWHHHPGDAGDAFGAPSGGRAPVGGPTGRASVGSAPVGSASVGSASVAGASVGGGPAGRASVGGGLAGRASVGSASVGSASVGSAAVGGAARGGAPVGKASVGSASVGATRVGRAGTAAVPGAPHDDGYYGGYGVPHDDGYHGGYGVAPGAAGRARVGRATVRPISPAGPGFDDLDDPDGAGAGGVGPGGVGPGGPGGPARGAKGVPAGKRSKRRKRANVLIAAAAVLVILIGFGVVGITWFYDDPVPYNTSVAQTTSIVYSDGKELARLGEQNRTVVPDAKISEVVKRAVIAAEDKNFMDHSGIDMKGIARAAWNNFTGGDTQGASTITQQYARHAAEMNDISYNRKIREAVLARKIEQDYTKDQILGLYLNAIYFGRGAYGVEAAAQAYFKKSVTTAPGSPKALTPEEAAVLASVIKQPEATPGGHKGYDPQMNLEAAKERWGYTLDNMAEKGWITPQQRAAAVYPKKSLQLYDPKKCSTDCGIKTPRGNVVNYVAAELDAMGIDWKKGGYKITTTINAKAQKAAEEAARRVAGSPMANLPKNYMAALVAVDPSNGRVLAYYGGDDGTGFDYAGVNFDAKTGKIIGGGHAAGSTFKVYTLAAGLREDIAFETHWDSTKKKANGQKISNADRDPSCRKWCDLKESTVESYNFPFYWIADAIGPDKVVEAARDAGIRMMWPDRGAPVDLTKASPKDVAPSKFGQEVGFGQYKVTVLDQANSIATIAARGKYNKAHFIRKVEKRDPVSGKLVQVEGEQLKPDEVFTAERMDNLNGVLQEVPGHSGKNLANGRPAIGKTGTWEIGPDRPGNGDAWIIGATPQIASAVWVGTKGDRKAIKEADGADMYGGGTPTTIWKQFMDKVHDQLNLPIERFPERKITGDPNHPAANGVQPAPQPAPTTPTEPCTNPIPIFCPDPDQEKPDNQGDQDQGDAADDNNPATSPFLQNPDGNGGNNRLVPPRRRGGRG